MALPSPKRVIKLTGLYLKKYQQAVDLAGEEPLEAAEIYDGWFRSTFRQTLEALLVIEGGKWVGAKEAPAIIRQAGLVAENGAAELLGSVVTEWTAEYYPQFWQVGLEMWKINKELQGLNPPRKVKPTSQEADHVVVLASTENATM